MKRRKDSKSQRRASFRELVDELRGESAMRARERAMLALRLRHAMLRSGRHRAARMLAEIAGRAIELVVRLSPPEASLMMNAKLHVAPTSLRGDGRSCLRSFATALPEGLRDAGEREAG